MNNSSSHISTDQAAGSSVYRQINAVKRSERSRRRRVSRRGRSLFFEPLEAKLLLAADTGNEPPVVDAGFNQTIKLSSAASLHGIVSDDGVPGPSPHELAEQAYQLDREFDFRFVGDYLENRGGQGERWLQSADQTWYFITPEGALFRWDNGPDLATSELIARFDESYHTEPVKLHQAPDPAVVVDQSIFDLDQQLGLNFSSDFLHNWANRQEKWLISDNGGWYFILPNGDLRHWNGQLNLNTSPLIQSVDAAFYDWPGWLAEPLDPNFVDAVAGELSTIWSKVSGPGEVTFVDPTSLDTGARFSEAGTYQLRLRADDGEFKSSDEVTVNVVDPPQDQPPMVAHMGSESAIVSGSILTVSDPAAVGGMYHASNTFNEGEIRFQVNVASAGDYVIWARVFAPNSGQDSFFVSVDDGSEDIFDVAINNWQDQWQWGVVNGRQSMSNPRVFTLSEGSHSITFRGREVNTGLNGLLITNDLAYVPQNPSTVDAGPDRTVSILDTHNLDATVLDDGLPVFTTVVTLPGSNGIAELAYQLDQDLGLRYRGDSLDNRGGLGEKWLYGANEAWYFITPDGKLYRWDGLANLSTSPLVATLDESYYATPAKLYDAPDPRSIEQVAFDLDQQLELNYTASFLHNWAGTGEKWLQSDSGASYFITPAGDLYLWNGSRNLSTSLLIASLNEDFHEDPSRLAEAPDPNTVLVTSDALVTTWSKVSGPGSVTFGDPADPDTTVEFDAPGTYVLRLEAHDGEFMTSDEVVFTVEDPSQTAVPSLIYLDAETALLTAEILSSDSSDAIGGRYVATTVTNRGEIHFAADIESDGEYVIWARILAPNTGQDSFFVAPHGGEEDIYDVANFRWKDEWQWTRVNGRSSASDPRVFSLSAGHQIITFRGREVNTGLDGILVTNDMEYVPHEPPAVDAGADQTVLLSETLTLNAHVSNDWFPAAPRAVTTKWSKVSGPGAVTIRGAAAVDTTVSFESPGTYVLRLEASDGQFTTQDELTVTVEVPPQQQQSAILHLEAESATIAGPILTLDDRATNGRRFVTGIAVNQGTVDFSVDLPTAGDYVVWARVLAPNSAQDSFFVSVDGEAEDIYDVADLTWSDEWQWTQVNGRNTAADPRVFTLSAGTHSILFRGRERLTGLDKIVVTNDLDYVPIDPPFLR